VPATQTRYTLPPCDRGPVHGPCRPLNHAPSLFSSLSSPCHEISTEAILVASGGVRAYSTCPGGPRLPGPRWVPGDRGVVVDARQKPKRHAQAPHGRCSHLHRHRREHPLLDTAHRGSCCQRRWLYIYICSFLRAPLRGAGLADPRPFDYSDSKSDCKSTLSTRSWARFSNNRHEHSA